MRRLAVALLALFRRVSLLLSKLSLMLRGKTPEDAAAERVVSGKSWDEFCDTLKAAGAALNYPGAPRDAFHQAEGYRYLTRLARAGLLAFIEHADPRAPVLHEVASETIKIGMDNPDNYYFTAAIRGDYEYRVFGKRNTIGYLGFGTQIGHYGQGGDMPTTGYLEAADIEFDDDDGHFEIFLSAKKQQKNWLPMVPETATLIIRQTAFDRTRETPAQLDIECLSTGESTGDVAGENAPSPTPLTAAKMDEGLKSASTLVAGASMLFANWVKGFQKHSNKLPRFDPEVSLRAGGDPNIAYYHSHWALAEDEALVIEVTPPECEYWNFQLSNFWMESLDYTHHRIHTNKHLAHYEADGSVRILVAHEDPGLPNWLETTGHDQGTMCFRWVRAGEYPQPQTRVVKLASLRSG